MATAHLKEIRGIRERSRQPMAARYREPGIAGRHDQRRGGNRLAVEAELKRKWVAFCKTSRTDNFLRWTK
jgi:hypothetical protein